ncbi:MAG: septum formation initiator family protein [Deferribacterales bacterium]
MRHLIFLVVAIFLIIYLLFGNNGFIQYKELVKIREKYRRESMEYDRRIANLQEETELLKKDRDYLEMVIKRELNYKKKEEDLFIILNKNEKTDSNRDNKNH